METVLDESEFAIADTGVVANVIVYRNRDGTHFVQIYEWSSYNAGKGRTTAALTWLRQQYPGTISAHDCGFPGDDSFAYWKHQLVKGRIDEAFDDNMDPIHADTGG